MAVEAASRFRALGWGLMVGLAGLAAAALGRSSEWADSAVALAVLLVLMGGLLVEAALLAVGQRSDSADRAIPTGARPADGVVEVLAMAGVVTTTLDESSPWRRFDRIDPAARAGGRSGGAPSSQNPALLGQVALVSVFVGRDGRSWSDREIREAHESIRSVARWAEREAMAWSIPVNVGLADTFFQADDTDQAAVELSFVAEGDEVGPMEADSTTKSVAAASRVAGLLGFADVADLVGQINPTVAADAHVWLFHLKRRGRSHAIPAGDRVIDGVGMAICYAREASFPEPLTGPGRLDPTTVAHELLHLFGASDKYGVPLSRFSRGSVSRRDVMRLEADRLERLKIGRLTAIELGWPVA